MDSESKNKNSQNILTKRQSETESTTDADLVAAFPDLVHVAKHDCASFANWYQLVDGYRVNLVLLRTARTDPTLKEILLSHLFLTACRNRDRMDVDTVVEICSPELRKGLQRANWIVQTLVPEVYRLYDGNKEGVLKSAVSVCPASWGTLLVADKEKGKILSARLHYPVDVVEIVSGLSMGGSERTIAIRRSREFTTFTLYIRTKSDWGLFDVQNIPKVAAKMARAEEIICKHIVS